MSNTSTERLSEVDPQLVAEINDAGSYSELDIIAEAIALIDRGLGGMIHRELVSTGEVSDLLLDVRTLLAPSPAAK